MPIAFINNNFPALSATFIYNEVIGLRKNSIAIKTYSIWKPERHQVSDECHDLIDTTTYLIPINIFVFIYAVLFYIILRPVTLIITIYYLFTRKYKKTIKDRIRTIIHIFEGIYLSYLIKKEGGITHIHAHYASHPATIAYVVSLLNDIPFSFTAHASDIWIEELLIQEKLKSSKFVITCTEFGKRQLIEGRMFSNNIYTVYHGVNLQKYNGIPRNIGCNNKARLLNIGRLSIEKSQKTLIDICKCLYDNGMNFECWIVGDGPLYNELKDIIEKYSLQNHVFLKGKVKQEEIIKIYLDSDIFVLTSIRENLPNVLLESMAMGLPIIASDIAGIPELIKNSENGYLVPPNDINGFVNCVNQLLYNPELYYKISKNGIDTVKNNFNMVDSIEKIINIYRKYDVL